MFCIFVKRKREKNLKQPKMKHLKNYGSLQNLILANSESGTPQVGTRATIAGWSDRYVYDIVWVSDCKKKALIRGCNSKCHPDSQGGIGHQDWLIESNLGNHLKTIKFHRNEWRYEFEEDRNGKPHKTYGDRLAIVFNCQDYYYDWSF